MSFRTILESAVNLRLEKFSGGKGGCVCEKRDKWSCPTLGLGGVRKNERWSKKENLYWKQFKRARAKGKNLILKSFHFPPVEGDILHRKFSLWVGLFLQMGLGKFQSLPPYLYLIDIL